MPPGCIALRIKNIDALSNAAANTAAGKLLAVENLKPLRDFLSSEAQFQLNSYGFSPAFTSWLRCLKGELVLGMWDFDALTGGFLKMGFVADLAGPLQHDLHRNYCKLMALDQDVEKSIYKNSEIIAHSENGVVAAVGRHLIAAFDSPSAKELIDSLLNHKRRTGSAPYKRIAQSWGADPDIMFEMDLTEGTGLGRMGRMIDRKSDAEFALWSLSCRNNAFEERLYLTRSAAIPEAGIEAQPAPDLSGFGVMPSNAIVAGGGQLKAGLMLTAVKLLLVKIQAARAALVAADQKEILDAADAVSVALNVFDENSEMKLAEIAAAIKGPFGFWFVAQEKENKESDDLDEGVFLTFIDKEKAAAASRALFKMVKARYPVQESYLRDRTIYEIKDAEMVWTVADNRVYVCSSNRAMKRHLNGLLERTPKLNTQPGFIKAMAAMSRDEREGMLAYVDVKQILQRTSTTQDERYGELYKTLADAAKLPAFKDIPPATISIGLGARGFETIIRTPIPVLPSLLAWALTSGDEEDEDEEEK